LDTNIRPSRIGAVTSRMGSWLAAVLLCAVFFSCLTFGAVQAHVPHDAGTMEAPNLLDGSPEESGSSVAGPNPESAERECDIYCCSPIHCAPGLAQGFEASLLANKATDAFLLPPAVRGV